MILNHQTAKGLIFGVGVGLAIGIFTCGYGLPIWWMITLIDAILVASKLNQGRPVRDWEFF